MAGSERDYLGEDRSEWLVRYGHRDKVASHVRFLQWLYGADKVAQAGLQAEWDNGALSRVHLRTGDRETRISFVPKKSFITISEAIEDTVVSLDFNKPDEEGNVAQESSRVLFYVSAPEYDGATMCVIGDDKVEWESERVGHILSSIDIDPNKNNLLVTTRHGMLRLPLSANIYEALDQFGEQFE